MTHECLAAIRCFLLDMDGTIFLSDRLLPGADRLLRLFDERGLEYLILANNSSKARAQYGEKLRRWGLDVTDERIFTSGEARTLYLRTIMPGARVSLVSTPALEDTFREARVTLVQDGADVAVRGFDTTL